MEKKIKEYRTSEVRSADDGDKLIVEGYAAVFDSPTLIFESETTGYKYYEVVNRGAFDGADLSDVVMKYNHDDQAMVLARTRNKTLQLTVDDHGLKINAELANTSAGRDVYELIKRGDLDKMSFAFTVAEETITENVASILFNDANIVLPYYTVTVSSLFFFGFLILGLLPMLYALTELIIVITETTISAVRTLVIVTCLRSAHTRTPTFIAIAIAMFCIAIFLVCLEISIVVSILETSSPMITTSAASIAASVPNVPMATPISALESAGASFTPSPT